MDLCVLDLCLIRKAYMSFDHQSSIPITGALVCLQFYVSFRWHLETLKTLHFLVVSKSLLCIFLLLVKPCSCSYNIHLYLNNQNCIKAFFCVNAPIVLLKKRLLVTLTSVYLTYHLTITSMIQSYIYSRKTILSTFFVFRILMGQLCLPTLSTTTLLFLVLAIMP
jgi:hypothetical protein